MKKQAREALDAYFAEGDSWAKDRNDALHASRRVAWWVAGAACTVAVCEAFALLFLTPLKTVEPYTLLVDRQTGFVQPLKPLDPQAISGDKALTQSFLVQYVIAREGFDIDSLQSDYRKVGLWSEGSARSEYLSGVQVSNPDSPLARFPRSTVIDVRVKSVTSLGQNVAMVRYDTVRRDAGAQVRGARAWVAVIRYGYSGEPLSTADRMINPLGFRVSRYRRSIETIASDATPVTEQVSPAVPPPPGVTGYIPNPATVLPVREAPGSAPR